MARPLWIVGLDGMEPELLTRWVSAGRLPNIARCIERGASGKLLSTYNQLTASAWVTIATGVNPGAHGVYNFQERVPGQYRLNLPASANRKTPAFWETAGEAGCRALVVRVPMTYPLRAFNGVGVADWLAPSPRHHGFTHPPELAAELVTRFGWTHWGEYWGDAQLHRPDKCAMAFRRLLRNADTSFAVFDHLLKRERFDLFFGVASETDIASHTLWHHHDASHASHDPRAPEHLRNGLLSVYERVDRRLGWLLNSNEFNGNLLLISDHGSGPHLYGPHCVAPLLEAAGLTVRRQQTPPRVGLLSRARSALTQRIPWHVRRRLKPLEAATRAQGFTASLLSHIDFGRSKAFAYVCIQTGEIWLNLRGRDPDGLVEPGREADELCEYIRRLFMEARDPRTGQRPVAEVRRREELFAGPHMDVIPDIHVRFRDDIEVGGLTTRLADGTEITVAPPPEVFTASPGLHRSHGVFVACGPDIRPTDERVDGDLKDIAPTALALLDVPVPAHVEGRLLREVLRDSVSLQPATACADVAAAVTPEYSDDDLARVEKRLRALGYM